MCVQATAAGAKETEAVNMLEKKFKSEPRYGQKEAVELAISTLQASGCGVRRHQAACWVWVGNGRDVPR